MGILNILAALKIVTGRSGAEYRKNLYCEEFRGKKAGLDTHGLVHRALARLDFELQLQLVQRRSEREYELATDIVVRAVVLFMLSLLHSSCASFKERHSC